MKVKKAAHAQSGMASMTARNENMVRLFCRDHPASCKRGVDTWNAFIRFHLPAAALLRGQSF
jgi:hypothetical protein